MPNVNYRGILGFSEIKRQQALHENFHQIQVKLLSCLVSQTVSRHAPLSPFAKPSQVKGYAQFVKKL